MKNLAFKVHLCRPLYLCRPIYLHGRLYLHGALSLLCGPFTQYLCNRYPMGAFPSVMPPPVGVQA